MLEPSDKTKVMWAQLYFFDPDFTARRRVQNMTSISIDFKPRPRIIRLLHEIMLENNELVQVYLGAH